MIYTVLLKVDCSIMYNNNISHWFVLCCENVSSYIFIMVGQAFPTGTLYCIGIVLSSFNNVTGCSRVFALRLKRRNFGYIYLFLEEQNSQLSKRTIITPKEEEFLIRILQSETESALSKHAVLCEAAEQLYGQQYKQLLSRCNNGDQVESRVTVEPNGEGEKILLEKVIAHQTKQMENFYYSISQMVYNMAKLGGKTWCRNYFCFSRLVLRVVINFGG